MGIEKSLLRAGVDLATKLGPRAVVVAVREWNQMVLRGDIERARARIKLEFLKSRQLAELLYRKHRGDMDEQVRAIFEELIREGAVDG